MGTLGPLRKLEDFDVISPRETGGRFQNMLEVFFPTILICLFFDVYGQKVLPKLKSSWRQVSEDDVIQKDSFGN